MKKRDSCQMLNILIYFYFFLVRFLCKTFNTNFYVYDIDFNLNMSLYCEKIYRYLYIYIGI